MSLKVYYMTLVTIINKELETLAPIIFEFKDKTKKHVIIYDDKDKSSALKLKKWIITFNDNIELIEIDEDSKSDMLEVQNHINTLGNKEIYLNATNADSALLVIFSGSVLHNNGKIIAYDKFENSYNIVDKIGFTNHSINNNMKLKDFIEALGYEISKEIDKKEILNRQKALLILFNDFNVLFRLRKYIQQDRLNLIASKYPKEVAILIELELISKNYKMKKHISYFGTLFEEFIYLQVLKYNFDDIKVGTVILFESIKNDSINNIINNEFDILAIKDNHIYTIECKLGDNISASDIIYKSDSLLGYFGDDSKNMIVNIHPNNSDKIRKPASVFGKNLKLRAINNSIEIYNAYTFGSSKFDKKMASFFQVKKRVFLLGGADLEMQTIQKVLERYSQEYYDKNLSWGAKLSDYEMQLKNSYLYIGIELKEDMTLPKNYIAIDHHNENQHKKSSLEQVADIFNLQLTREGKLIALNDSGYISAMKKFGATSKEMEEIRKKDRKAQGVTKKDEILAQESILSQENEKDILIIFSKTDKFSAIIDRLYEKNVLIYSEKKLVYYGRDIQTLVNHFQDEIKNKKIYYGGDFGFFGLDEKSFNKDEILLFKEKILKILKMKKK